MRLFLALFLIFIMPLISRAQLHDDGFSVVTVKKEKPKAPEPPKDIKLVSPPHKCTMTSGMVTFQWTIDNPKVQKKKKKMELVIENIERKQKLSLATNDTKRRHYVAPGTYRWKVTDDKNKLQSHWRVFKVVSMNPRDVSSIKAKYQVKRDESKFVKDSPELPDLDDEPLQPTSVH